MRETWFVLEDGSVADPRDVAPDGSGVLRHKRGVAVAMKGQVPHSTGVDAEVERAKQVRSEPAAANKPPAEAVKNPVAARVTKPAPSNRFKTRAVKAR